jgi:LytS/YehU family sensor histidine kinase
MLWCAFYFGIHYFESYHASKDAQLQALLLQLNPHFLFNCLNSLRALIVEDPARAQVMVTEMSELLRYSLQSTRAETVTLGEELDAVSAYLRLESVRFEDRLQVQIQVDESLRDTRIPPMIVQILVENAIKHGISNLREGGILGITSQCDAGALKLCVRNSGQLAYASHTTRMGLNNARKRLKLQYGDRATLRIENDGPHNVLAQVSLPL